MKHLLCVLVLAALPVYGEPLLQLNEGSSAKVTIGPFKDVDRTLVGPEQVDVSIDLPAVPGRTGDTHIWSGHFTRPTLTPVDCPAVGTACYAIATIPYTALNVVPRTQGVQNAVVTYHWYWTDANGVRQRGQMWQNVQLNRRPVEVFGHP